MDLLNLLSLKVDGSTTCFSVGCISLFVVVFLATFFANDRVYLLYLSSICILISSVIFNIAGTSS